MLRLRKGLQPLVGSVVKEDGPENGERDSSPAAAAAAPRVVPPPASAAAPHRAQLASSINFRDLSDTSAHVQRGRVFRGSQLVSTAELARLSVRTVLDLRQPSALCTAHPHNLRRLMGACLRRCTRLLYPGARETVPEHETELEPCFRCTEACCESYGVKGKVYHVDLLPRTVCIFILREMPFRLQLRVVWAAMRRQQPDTIMAGAVANPQILGYQKLYKILLERSKPRLQQVFRLLSESCSYPVLIHCLHGKDRTGLISMLLLLLCDADRQAVVSDYALSEALLRESREKRELLSLADYLTTDDIISAAAEVMQGTIDHIYEKYGSVAGYLEHLGLSKDQVEGIKVNLTAPGAVPHPDDSAGSACEWVKQEG